MANHEQIVQQARSWLGTRYHHQGRLKKSDTSLGGVDCIGLIIGVARELGINSITGNPLTEFDETSYSAYPDGKSLKAFLDKHLHLVERARIMPGDVLLFRFFTHPQHVAIASDYGHNRDFQINTNNKDDKYKDGELGILHCYSGSGKVVEHIISPAWHKMLVAIYRFDEII